MIERKLGFEHAEQTATKTCGRLGPAGTNWSTLLKTVVGYFCPSVGDHPGLLIVQQCQCSTPISASGPVFTRI